MSGESLPSRAGELDPSDPQVIVAAAINDVITLARIMSPASDFTRGAVEMRRRLHVMDVALAAAEKAGVLQDNSMAETVQ